MRRSIVALSLALVLTLIGLGWASDVDLPGLQGHPRDRFPLAVYFAPSGDKGYDSAARRSLRHWNALTRETLAVQVFYESTAEAKADVVVAFEQGPSPRLMSAVRLQANDAGVIQLPVHITIHPVEARGDTPGEVFVYHLVAHELGHALGLGHTRNPRSIMCCLRGTLDWTDPIIRQSYASGRTRPDVKSVAGQLAEHYEAFWKKR